MSSIILRAIVGALLITSPAAAQPTPLPIQDGQTLRLWTGTAPGALGATDGDVPAITVYLPRAVTPNTPAVVICPGGSYVTLATNHEGRQVAALLNSMGIAAFVLRSRLGPRYHHPIELGDAQRAVRMVRARAADWRLDPARIGIMGFSAGGHLAMTVSTQPGAGTTAAADPVDRVSSRPDFAILGYPVISLIEPWTHAGSRDNLLGQGADPAVLRQLSGELAVTTLTPPTFLFHTNDDAVVPPEHSVQYYLALRKAGVPAELHVFQHGAHGVGLAHDDPALSSWSTLLVNWLRLRGVVR